MKIKMVEVKSSCIKSIGYEEEKNELFVEFNSGKIYKYPNCSKTLYENFMNSTSKGRFLNDYFVGSNYVKVN